MSARSTVDSWGKNMAYSMTAFGQASGSDSGKDYKIEIKSVNSRFFDCTVRISSIYSHLEEKVKAYLQSRGISRGKISVFINVDVVEDSDAEITVDEAYAEQYIAALKKLRDRFELKDDISVMRVASNRDVFTFKKPAEDGEKDWQSLLPVLSQATDEFLKMRLFEGENLRKDLTEKMETVRKYVEHIKAHADDAQEKYRARLEQKLRATLEGLNIETDQARILTECAIFADKTAIDEELVRLDSHYKSFYDTISAGDSVGRKLDFLFQEVNREVNTIGSKVSDIELTKTVVEIKTLLEKIREQIQNLE